MKVLFILTLSFFITSFSVLAAPDSEIKFNDSHFHLTNYIQEGTDINKFLEFMGDRVERSTLFGIPLQQTWSYRVSGNVPPTYYLSTDSGLYYYSFTDAMIAMSYLSLSEEKRKRFDPMITGFNPTDMYAADHIKRVLKTFPNVFSGIGEFTIHKEFVSSKVAGEVASLNDPALDRILDFAGEAGLVAIIHNDIDVPFPKMGDEPAFLKDMLKLLKRHKKTKIIWAHAGLGRVIRPVNNQMQIVERMLNDKDFNHVYFDISWDEVAKYMNEKTDGPEIVAKVINKYSTRFLFGTDVVAPKKKEDYFKVFSLYGPLWNLLTPEASENLRFKNYNRLFDEARKKVREWEKKNS